MPAPLYFGLWLAAALVAIGFLSAFLARQRRWRELRRAQGLRMLAALERYCGWVGMQRRAPQFQGESAEAVQALDEARATQQASFPELASEMAQLLTVHEHLMHFLRDQQELRMRDAEAWLESDHDARFDALAEHEAHLIAAMRRKLSLAGALEASAAAAPAHQARATPDIAGTT
jgi:hypothetical protein